MANYPVTAETLGLQNTRRCMTRCTWPATCFFAPQGGEQMTLFGVTLSEKGTE